MLASVFSGQTLARRAVAPTTSSRGALLVSAAHKKGSGSTKNGRDSQAKRRGVKVFGGQPVRAGGIIVRQVGSTVSASSISNKDLPRCHLPTPLSVAEGDAGQNPSRFREQ